MDFGFVDEISDDDAEDDVVDKVDLAHYQNSAKLLSRLQIEDASDIAKAYTGNGKKLTLQAIRNAATQPPKFNLPSKPPVKTPEELAADKAELEKQTTARLAEAMKARAARDKEIKAMVAQAIKRDRRDFSALAEEFIGEDSLNITPRAATDFALLMLNSEAFKPVGAVVGSGIEAVIEPIDRFKGTPGFQFAMSEQGKVFFDRWKNQGRHNFSLTLQVPSDFLNATQTSTSPHTLTAIEYKPGVAPLGLRPLRIKQIIPGGSTSNTTIRGRREDAFTDDAATVTEVGALANMAVSVLEVDYPVKDIGGYIEVSENLMADYEAIISLINVRVPYKVERVTDYQLLNGSGSGADLTGLLNASGLQTQAKGADTAVDAIFKAKTLVENVPNATQANAGGGYNPDHIIVNPVDWQNIRLLKDANSQYYGGGPFTGAYGNGAGYSNVEMLWGLPCVRTTAIAAGTALVGAFGECAQWFQRQGLVIEMTNSNGTNFINRIVTIRAAERLALTIDQPNGFAQITGL
jgi:HK97 family phage major capsid protein